MGAVCIALVMSLLVPSLARAQSAGAGGPSVRSEEAPAGAPAADLDAARGTPAPDAVSPARSSGASRRIPGRSPERSRTEPVERLTRQFEATSDEDTLDLRVGRVRAEASRMGMWNAEPAARGVLLSDRLGSQSDRARAAVLLAPGLPAAWGALALADPGLASIPALGRGLLEMERNLDASVWWRATAWHVLAWGLMIGGILFLAGSALRLAPDAAHDLSHRLPGRLPPHALAAILASAAMLPAALGEGLVGLAAGAFLLAIPWAGARHRGALVAAMISVIAAVHPVTAETGRWIAALRADPGTVAIRNAEVGGLSVVQRERLARLAPTDPAAGHALAIWSKRSARLGEAEQWLEVVNAAESGHPVLLNDAANVRLATGDADGAIELYELAVRSKVNAAVLFNLAQVRGSRIELAQQEMALGAAHTASARTVRELSELRGSGRLAVDIPWPVADLRNRLASAADGRDVAAALRSAFGSGRGVEEPIVAGGGLLLLSLVAFALGRGRRESRVCGACRARRCESCSGRKSNGCGVCGAPSGSLSWVDAAVAATRPVLLRTVPGLAGVVAGSPWFGWIAATAAATAGAAVVLRAGVVPDPLAAGQIGQLGFLLAALVLASVWGLSTLWSLRSLR